MSNAREQVAAGRRLDRPTLVSFIAVGMAWLLLFSLPWGGDGTEEVFFFLIGVLYVLGGATWRASNTLRMPDTAWDQVIVPGLLWLVAIVFWFAVWLNLGITAQNNPDTAYLVNGVSIPEDIAMALFGGTVSFLMWLLPSLGVRSTWLWITRERPRGQNSNSVG